MDLISRQEAIDAIDVLKRNYPSSCFEDLCKAVDIAIKALSAQSQTCEGCKHLGKWENEVEYGYPSPCTRCERRVEDHYER